MSWFFIALGAPFLWAITNHIDKLLLEKYFVRCGVSTLIVFSSVVGVLTLPFLYFAASNVFAVSLINIALLILVGLLSTLAIWLYFNALEGEEASIVVVFYQLIPVFGFFLGYLLLGETLTTIQVAAMALILLGASVISVEVDTENNFKLKKRTIFLMTLAALVSAADSVLFKYVALQETVWTSLFWEYTGLTLFGVLLFIFTASCRTEVLHAFKNNSAFLLAINLFNEFLYILGNFLFAFSYLLAPIALVMSVNSYQPLMVLLIGIILTIFFPKLGTESIKLRHVLQKLIAIAIVGIGTYLLFLG